MGDKLARTYGHRVTTKYVDVFSPEMLEHAAALDLVRGGRTPLPIVFVDGKGKFAGGISVEMISKELEKLGLAPVATGEPVGSD